MIGGYFFFIGVPKRRCVMAKEFSRWNALVGQPKDTAIAEKMQEELSTKEAALLDMRFGLADNRPTTLDETGTAFGIMADDVRGIEALALRKLRHGFSVHQSN